MLGRFSRQFSINSDKFGIDPLLDNRMSKIQSIAFYKEYTLGAHEKGAPDLISINNYQTDEFWWHIMCYNSIFSYKELVEGLKLRIPDYSELLRVSSVNQNNTGSPVLVDRLIEI
jgi:hypothetical protein